MQFYSKFLGPFFPLRKKGESWQLCFNLITNQLILMVRLQVQTKFLEKCYFCVLQYRTGTQLVLNKADSDSVRNWKFVVHWACLHYLSILCLTDLYCARMTNESRKRKRVLNNKKNALFKRGSMNVESRKSVAEKFGISTPELSWNFKLFQVLKASNLKEFKYFWSWSPNV